MKIPEGSQSSAQFRLRNKGVPDGEWRRGRGDLFVHLDYKIPARLTREQRKLMEQLGATLPVDNGPFGEGAVREGERLFHVGCGGIRVNLRLQRPLDRKLPSHSATSAIQ